MGGEIGQWNEWNYSHSVDWHLAESDPHRGVQKWVEDLNRAYRAEPALHELDFDAAGFEWINCTDAAASTLSFIRKGRTTQDLILAVCNFTPVVRMGYRVGVPRRGRWVEILNSDSPLYDGSGQGNSGGMEAETLAWDGRLYSLPLTLPPLAIVFFKNTAG